LIAKTQPAFDRLRAQFRERRVKKSYWALVWGITPVQGSIADALAHDRHDKRRMQVILPPSRERPKGWAALTKYRRLETHGRFSLLELEMQTGVTHQIRAHLANVGYPIVGDSIYGLDSADSLGLKRHFLHAFRLEFHHPEDRRKIVVESPLPAELQRVLNSLQVDG
jgi:23S rRNA pseudouridine1911/1915/1917 synthase